MLVEQLASSDQHHAEARDRVLVEGAGDIAARHRWVRRIGGAAAMGSCVRRGGAPAVWLVWLLVSCSGCEPSTPNRDASAAGAQDASGAQDAASALDTQDVVRFEFTVAGGPEMYLRSGCTVHYELYSADDGYLGRMPHHGECTAACDAPDDPVYCGACLEPGLPPVSVDAPASATWDGVFYPTEPKADVTDNLQPDNRCHRQRVASPGDYRVSVPVWDAEARRRGLEPSHRAAVDFTLPGALGEVITVPLDAEGEQPPAGWPPGYRVRCADDANVCEAPYTCLQYDGPVAGPRKHCTVHCEVVDDCPPVWTGHCGDVTRCDAGVCGSTACG